MKKYLKHIMPNWVQETDSKESSQVNFVLSYGSLPVGHLIYSSGKWKFYYTKQFQIQEHIKPLTDFPNTEKLYESEELWPFFASRIPSINRPEIKKILQSENIDANDIVDLLIRFGKNTITNPFDLSQSNSAA